MPDSTHPTSTIDFSIVTAVYNVARYLDEFIESVESQTFPRERFEVIAVNDGSTDESLEILRAWEARQPGLVRVITKENGGQSTARNLGTEYVRGAWVTFTDPDDVIRAEYLAEVAAFIADNPAVSMIATNRLILNDTTREVANSHPLRRQFAHGNRVRDINHYPEYFHGSAPAAFFPSAELRRQGLAFDSTVRPNWEDGHFCAHYLLGMNQPTIGFVATAHYLYRKRQDNTSTLQGSFADPGRYTVVMRRGFLDALTRGRTLTGSRYPPSWLQNFVLYELSWYYSSQEAHAGVASAAVGPVADEFHSLVREVLEFLDPDIIAGFTARPLKQAWIDILLHAYTDEPWHQEYGHVSGYDARQGLVRIAYRYTGAPPREEVLSGGQVVAPTYAKVRDLVYHDRVLMMERILWLSARKSVRIRLNERDLNLQFSVPRRNHTLRPGELQTRLAPRAGGRATHTKKAKPAWIDRVWRRLARTRPIQRIFAGSWVLIDRIGDAGDSGERLFEYLRVNRPDINAWFVVARDSHDWRRLRRAYGRRVLAHGSLWWKLAMANSRHLVSSHVDVPIVRPPALMPVIKPRWRFTFLQHGVIKDDLSNWLNPKPIDMLITSTPQEYASIAGDHTPYVFSAREVKLTGLPRFDRLRRLGSAVPPERRDLILVAPTWRVHLVQPLVAGSNARVIDPSFFASDFAINWLTLLRSPDLERLAGDCGLRIGFLPHPVLQPVLSDLHLPRHVIPLSFADHDVQELFARSAVMVTDYSSMAFNAAYIDRPLVYFQFDFERVKSGEHLGRRGYFDYERDGFGPVTYGVDGAVSAITDVVRAGRAPSATYQARIDATFPMRDGRCCERVVAEIENLTRRLSADEMAKPVPAPAAPPPVSAAPTR